MQEVTKRRPGRPAGHHLPEEETRGLIVHAAAELFSRRGYAAVAIGDIVRTRLHSVERIYRVTGLGVRRGSAAEAATLFEDLTPPPPPRAERPLDIVRDRGAGRPTKRDRREIDRLRGRE